MIEIAFMGDVTRMRTYDQLGLEGPGVPKTVMLSQNPISLPDKHLLNLGVQVGFGLFDQDKMERRDERLWLCG